MEPHCCCWLASKIGTCYNLLIFFQDLLPSWKDGEKKLVKKLWWVLAWRDAFVFFFPILIHVCVFMQHFIRHFITEFTAAARRIAWPPRKDVKNCLQGPSLVSFSPTTILFLLKSQKSTRFKYLLLLHSSLKTLSHDNIQFILKMNI